MQPEKAKTSTLACSALHNFIRAYRTFPRGAPPQQGRANAEQLQGNQTRLDSQAQALRTTAAATAMRDQFCSYVNTAGAMP